MSTTTHPTKETKDAADAVARQAENETVAVLRSLRALLEGDEQEQRETFEYLRKALDEDRPSHRRLFG